MWSRESDVSEAIWVHFLTGHGINLRSKDVEFLSDVSASDFSPEIWSGVDSTNLLVHFLMGKVAIFSAGEHTEVCAMIVAFASEGWGTILGSKLRRMSKIFDNFEVTCQ